MVKVVLGVWGRVTGTAAVLMIAIKSCELVTTEV